MIVSETIPPSELRAALVGTRFASNLRHFSSIDSTNAAMLAAADSLPEGTVYFADEQTAGRGRGGHAWHSARGEGLYVSALVKPPIAASHALLLSLATGIAAAEAIAQVSGLAVDLRWPNDLMLTRADGSSRKCGGILVESAVGTGEQAMLRYAVIGIGLNVAHTEFPTELRTLATSLAIESGSAPSRMQLLVQLLRALDEELSRLEAGEAAETLFARFRARSTWAEGKRVNVPEQGGYTGVTAGLDAYGFLRVQGDDGKLRTVLSGGVRETA